MFTRLEICRSIHILPTDTISRKKMDQTFGDDNCNSYIYYKYVLETLNKQSRISIWQDSKTVNAFLSRMQAFCG